MKKELFSIVLLSITVMVYAQTTYVNPLERWASYNVQEVNTFATGEETTAPGKFFQFGRNMSFPTTGYVTIETGALTPQDARTWTSPSLLYPADPTTKAIANWYSEVRDDLNTWEKIVGETMLAPDVDMSYKGMNNGNPCPEGYHLPTINEAYTILKGSFVFDQIVENLDVAEKNIDLYGDNNLADYVADYKKVDNNTVVGLRFKGTSNASAFIYQLVDYATATGHITIKAKAAGDATINDIAGWNEAAWSDAVVRHLPLSGYRLSYTNLSQQYISNVGKEVYFWLNTIDPTKRNYAMALGFMGWNATNRVFGTDYFSKSRDMGAFCRCIKNSVQITTALPGIEKTNLVVTTGKENLKISTDETGLELNISSAAGANIYIGKMQQSSVSVQVAPGVYIIKVGNAIQKAIVN